MSSPSTLKSLLCALAIGFTGPSALPAACQQADVRMQGTVERIDNGSLSLRGKDGAISTVSLDSKTAIFKAGDYVASAAVKGADGKLRSKELRIFPEALRGIGEGQRPMDAAETLMTNASVSEVVAAPDGQVVKVKYQNGTAELIVGPEVPVTAVIASDGSALKAGTRVFVTATKTMDGALTATRILATN